MNTGFVRTREMVQPVTILRYIWYYINFYFVIFVIIVTLAKPLIVLKKYKNHISAWKKREPERSNVTKYILEYDHTLGTIEKN